MNDIVERLRSPASVFYEYSADNGALLKQAAAEIEKLRAALKQAKRDALEEAARRVEMMWLRFREKDEGTSDWIFQKYDDIPTGDDFVAAIRALGEKE